MTPIAPIAQTSSAPAGGAPIGDVIWGTAAATLITALVIWAATAHRAGRIRWLGRLAGFAERSSGLPGWCALPTALAAVSLIVAVFGFYWDVAKHIDTGRDPGPFGTAAHYPILVGLFGIALAGFTAIVLGVDRRVPTAIRVTRDWHAPLGGVLIFLCGGFALTGFPLDDVWHTLFGQDVTLWGPTHVLMIGGASLSTLGVWVLLAEGRRARTEVEASREPSLLRRLRGPAVAGAFLIGLSTLQGEFDYGVPQFQLVYQPILIMLAAGVGLVTARVRLGRGGALTAVAFFLALRGLLTLIIGPVIGAATLHFPLYLVEAAVVELVGLRVPSSRPLTLGAIAGLGIGTLGLAAEWGWSHVWMPLPWPGTLLPEAAILGLAAALAGAVLGGYIGRALTADDAPPQRGPAWLGPAAAVLAVACIAYPLPMDAGSATSAAVTLRNVKPPPQREVQATVRLHPADAAEGSQWLTATSWQGGGLVVDRLERVGNGVFRTTEPLPAYGQWKTLIRLENGRALRAVPVYLPADPAIPAPKVAAPQHFERSFVRDKKILQRESVGGTVWLTVPAYLLLLAIVAGWLTALTWGMRRLEGSARPSGRTPGPRAAPSRRVVRPA